MGWLLVAFDLPVGSKSQRRAATNFRKFLIDDGYLMIQYSVYVRSCVSYARQQTHLARVKDHVPDEGTIRAIFITRSQWERSYIVHGSSEGSMPPEEIPEQMVFW